MLNEKGQGSVFAFFSLLVGLILIVAFIPLVSSLVNAATAELNDSTYGATNLVFNQFTIFLIGIIFLIVVILFIMSLMREFSNPRF